MDEFLQELRRDVTDNYHDDSGYVARKVGEIFTRDDLGELHSWASDERHQRQLPHRAAIIEARMRVIIRRAWSKRNTIAVRQAVDYAGNANFGRF